MSDTNILRERTRRVPVSDTKPVRTELGVGAAYAAIAFTLVRWFEFEGRRRVSLETY